MRTPIISSLLLALASCGDEDACVRRCDARHPQDGAARARCQLDCAEQERERGAPRTE